MRITNTMLINNMVQYMGNNLSRMEKYQYQLATGKKIQLPSDDPIVATRALKLRTDVAEIEQYQKNTKDALSWMEITENTIAGLGDILSRAKELTVQAANGTLNADDTKSVKEEIDQLKQQAIHLANTTYAGRYIFSGYKTDKPLMDSNGNYLMQVDNTENINFQIGIGDSININVCGGDLFNANGAAVGAGDVGTTPSGSLIDIFNQLSSALAAGDHLGAAAQLANIEKMTSNMLRVRSDLGARQNRIELTDNRLDGDYISFTKLMSENEDVDEAEAIMMLKNEENVYRASLAGGARIIQTSLVDFLR